VLFVLVEDEGFVLMVCGVGLCVWIKVSGGLLSVWIVVIGV